jgi:precorrin-6A/cobalt-precorrin-6A reductase
VRFERRAWNEREGDCWHRVDDVEAAAELVPNLGTRVLLTIGRKRLSAFAGISNVWFLARCIDPPSELLPGNVKVLLARGPFTLEGERQLLRRHQIDLLVTRDSGGKSTEAKLDAARELGIPVIVIRRPTLPEAPTVASADQAVAWAHARCASQRP